MAMIKFLHVVNWLIDATERSNTEWQRKEDPRNLGDFYGGCYADFNSGDLQVTITLDTTCWRGIDQTRIVLTSPGQHKIIVLGPLPKVFSRSKYESEDDAELAAAMKKLFKIAMDQHFQRQEKYKTNEEVRKQEIFHRLLYGKPQLSY